MFATCAVCDHCGVHQPSGGDRLTGDQAPNGWYTQRGDGFALIFCSITCIMRSAGLDTV